MNVLRLPPSEPPASDRPLTLESLCSSSQTGPRDVDSEPTPAARFLAIDASSDMKWGDAGTGEAKETGLALIGVRLTTL